MHIFRNGGAYKQDGGGGFGTFVASNVFLCHSHVRTVVINAPQSSMGKIMHVRHRCQWGMRDCSTPMHLPRAREWCVEFSDLDLSYCGKVLVMD